MLLQTATVMDCRGVSLLLAILSFVNCNKNTADTSCVQYSLQQLWSSSLRDAPIISTPLLLDIDADGYRDIMVTSTSGEVWALHGENGHVVDNWPFHLEDRAFFASPLSYDLNRDGVDDVILATTDAEILFLQIDATILHGETIKLPPLRVRRDWYQLDSSYTARLATELRKQVGNDKVFTQQVGGTKQEDSYPNINANVTTHSKIEEDNPLFSRHQPGTRPSGVAEDSSFVYIDPHILATPVLADMNMDGKEDELVVPVSYYYDPHYYGAHPEQLQKLRMPKDELINYSAGAVVVVSLSTGQIVRQKLLSLTKVSADQPGYLLASPTVARLYRGDPPSVIIGSVSGELHLLYGSELDHAGGYPVSTDSITAQVAVEDVTGDGVMEIVVVDRSGNVICLNRHGQRLWEQETSQSIESSVRFAKFGGSYSLDIVFVTKEGAVWVLNGTTGHPVKNTPISLNSHVFSSILLTYLPSRDFEGDKKTDVQHLNAVVASQDGLFVVDLENGCVDRFSSDHLLYSVLSDHIDPFNIGLEILATSLSGHLICYSTGAIHPPSNLELSRETWASETHGQNGFTHKNSSFFLVTDHEATIRDEVGSSFELQFDIVDSRSSSANPQLYTAVVLIGNKYVLLNESIAVNSLRSSWQYSVPTPPSPMPATVLLRLCNQHTQCDHVTFRVRFNMTFHDMLKWCLSLPFLGLVFGYLWLLRNESTTSLPTAYRNSRKLL